MCCIILVLVFWQLDSDSHNAQDKMLRRVTYVPRSPTETPEAHMIRRSTLQHKCRAKHKLLRGDEMIFAVEWLRNLKKERTGIAMSWTSVQGVELGAGRCTGCWHRLDECGTGSDGVEGQDGCDDLVEKAENGSS